MDKIPENSIDKEKEYFLSKLKRNPIFMLKHLPSLSNILWRRYQHKLTLRRGPHQAGKICPPWLHSINAIHNRYVKVKPELWFNLPHHPLPPKIHTSSAENGEIHRILDREDYLAENRWLNLIENIFIHELRLPDNVRNWFKNPPDKTNLAWETYSCCERIANFITWISFIPYEQRLNLIPPQALVFVQTEMTWIAEHLEYYQKQTGNHILNNARALMMAGTLLKNPGALETGLEILRQMLPILIQPQGALREGSSHYQLIVFKWLLDAYSYAKRSQFYTIKKLQFLHDTLLKMQTVAGLFCNQQGDLDTFIGDISPDARPIITTQLLRHLYPAYWQHFPNALSTAKPHYDNWHCLQNHQHKIISNVTLGHYPQQIASHKHNDLLSFVWHFENQPIFIDAGRARYTKDKTASLQKSAIGHNTVLVNNMAPVCESLIVNGHWYPTPYANAHIQIDGSQAHYLAIKHNGFKRATKVKEHERIIQLMPNSLLVNDRFSGIGMADIILIWQLHPSFIIKKEQPLNFYNEHYHVTIETHLPPIYVRAIEADEIVGFHSTEYGMIKRHPVLMLYWQAALPFKTNLIFKVTSCAG